MINRCSIPGMSYRSIVSLNRPNKLRGSSSLLLNTYKGAKLITDHHTVSKLQWLQLYLYPLHTPSRHADKLCLFLLHRRHSLSPVGKGCFKENACIYCDNHKKRVRNNAEFLCVTASGKHTYHWDFRMFSAVSISVRVLNVLCLFDCNVFVRSIHDISHSSVFALHFAQTAGIVFSCITANLATFIFWVTLFSEHCVASKLYCINSLTYATSVLRALHSTKA